MPLVSNKSRRKPKNHAINPLAAARPNPKTLESLWHVKTGAGYQLFTEYYRQQPAGVVCEACTGSCLFPVGTDGTVMQRGQLGGGGSSTNQEPHGKAMAAGRGFSRAAKRKRKRRGEDVTSAVIVPLFSDASKANDKGSSGAEMSEDVSSTTRAEAQSHEDPQEPTQRVNIRLLQESGDPLVCHCKNGFGAFRNTLTRPLPITFRLRSHLSAAQRNNWLHRLSPYCQALRDKLSEDSMVDMVHTNHASPVTMVGSVEHQDTVLGSDPPRQALLHGPQPTFLFSIVDPMKLRADPSLANVILEGTSSGCLARQELGSLLPVLAARHYVATRENQGGTFQRKRIRRILDLCSAPGSKTLQLVEWMMERKTDELVHGANGGGDGNIPTSSIQPVTIRANDVNPRRLEELKEAIHRSGVLSGVSPDNTHKHSPSAASSLASSIKLKYSNQDASRYADAKLSMRYDIILADVPCSGDGTVRKDARVLPYWTPRTAVGLHPLQVNILCRALQLLAVDGVAVYSTCSLNPIENEAVVAAAMQRANKFGSNEKRYELLSVKVPQLLTDDCHRGGMSSWKVADYSPNRPGTMSEEEIDSEKPSLTWYNSFEEASAAGMEGAHPFMWPVGPTESNESSSVAKCLRLWPQDANSGGFFVALIRRNS